jgi:hypothetical protein
VIDWGDGNVTAGVVTRQADSTFTVTGSYTYLANVAAVTLPVTVTITDASGQTAVAKARVVIVNVGPNGLTFTGGLDPLSSIAPGAAPGFTNTNRPTFAGTAPPFATIQLFGRRLGVDATLPLGQTVASATGQWRLLTGPLVHGPWIMSAVVTPPGGYPGPATLLANNGLVVIDTTRPVVLGAWRSGRGNRVVVNFQDEWGMNLARMLDPSNYAGIRARGAPVHPVVVAPNGSQSVALSFGGPASRLRSLTVSAARLTNNAGTPLAADFTTVLRSKPKGR